MANSFYLNVPFNSALVLEILFPYNIRQPDSRVNGDISSDLFLIYELFNRYCRLVYVL